MLLCTAIAFARNHAHNEQKPTPWASQRKVTYLLTVLEAVLLVACSYMQRSHNGSINGHGFKEEYHGPLSHSTSLALCSVNGMSQSNVTWRLDKYFLSKEEVNPVLHVQSIVSDVAGSHSGSSMVRSLFCVIFKLRRSETLLFVNR